MCKNARIRARIKTHGYDGAFQNDSWPVLHNISFARASQVRRANMEYIYRWILRDDTFAEEVYIKYNFTKLRFVNRRSGVGGRCYNRFY